MAVKEEDKADVLAVLRALEIYDVKVCTLNQVNDLYLEAEENSSLKALWEKSESADPQIPLSVYEEEVEKSHQLHQAKIK
ncbi:TPA: hypothetical protein ACTXXA_001738 [Legionella anisa]